MDEEVLGNTTRYDFSSDQEELIFEIGVFFFINGCNVLFLLFLVR